MPERQADAMDYFTKPSSPRMAKPPPPKNAAQQERKHEHPDYSTFGAHDVRVAHKPVSPQSTRPPECQRDDGKGPDRSTFHEADGEQQIDAMTRMKRNNSVGAQLWQWVSSGSKQPSNAGSAAPSREGSLHGAVLFGKGHNHSPTGSRNNSLHGGSLFKGFPRSPAGSRESSQHGGSLFGSSSMKRVGSSSGMKREGSLSSLWNWGGQSAEPGSPTDSSVGSKSRESSQHGAGLFGGMNSAGSKSRESSQHGAGLFIGGMNSAGSKSREGSQHGAGLFGGMKRIASLGTQMWTWSGDGQDAPKEEPDLSCERSATSPLPSPPPPGRRGAPVTIGVRVGGVERARPMSPTTNTDRGV